MLARNAARSFATGVAHGESAIFRVSQSHAGQ